MNWTSNNFKGQKTIRLDAIARPLDRIARSLVRWFARSVARSLGRSLARPLDGSLARSLGRSTARSLAWSLSSAVFAVFSLPTSCPPNTFLPSSYNTCSSNLQHNLLSFFCHSIIFAYSFCSMPQFLTSFSVMAQSRRQINVREFLSKYGPANALLKGGSDKRWAEYVSETLKESQSFKFNLILCLLVGSNDQDPQKVVTYLCRKSKT